MNRRIKAQTGEAIYHCMSRIVAEGAYWGTMEKEVMRKQLWKTADFSGIQILTYCLMDNHFHILIRVPDSKMVQVSDAELLRRYRVLYPEGARCATLPPGDPEALLQSGGPQADMIRNKLLERMHDLSEFMKTFKQRFTLWYNRTHGRYGTLWAERYRSVLIEGTAQAARTVAAYIDLNPVRAGLIADPKDYRWCGYAEAIAGKPHARRGLLRVNSLEQPHCPTGPKAYSQALADYRVLLFGKGALRPSGKPDAPHIAPELAEKVISQGGELPPHILLRSRMRYFTDGAILGSSTFVRAQLEGLVRRGETSRKRKPKAIPTSQWQGLTVAKGFRNQTAKQA